MKWLSQSTDPNIHATAVRIAERFVYIIAAILRDEEKAEALREAYSVAVEELAVFQKGTPHADAGTD